MQKTAIIVAGGKGSRMERKIPKQFIIINKKPLLDYTIEAFLNCGIKLNIILVLPKDHIKYWKEISTTKGYNIVEGGSSRYHSVLNGLKTIKNGLVAIHDGARPLISKEIIKKGFFALNKNRTAIPVVSIKNSLRKLYKEGSKAVTRSKFKAVQTPQFFRVEIIKKAYENIPFSDKITDDASLAQENGEAIYLIEGEDRNIKITTPIDLELVSILLKNQG